MRKWVMEVEVPRKQDQDRKEKKKAVQVVWNGKEDGSYGEGIPR